MTTENKFAIERFEKPSACHVCHGEMKPMADADGIIVIHRTQVKSANGVVSMVLAYKLCTTCCHQQTFNITAMDIDVGPLR